MRNAEDTADEYYFSKVGVFGNRTSGVNFLRVATAVCFFINYLGFPCELFCDDFYLFGPRHLVRAGMRCLEKFCALIKLPLKASKRVEPAPCVPFVGIDIDYVAREARIPAAYLAQLKENITTGGWLIRRGHPRSDLESLIGKLALRRVRPQRPSAPLPLARLAACVTESEHCQPVGGGDGRATVVRRARRVLERATIMALPRRRTAPADRARMV